MRIIITTNQGTLVDKIEGDEVGDLSKPAARAELLARIDQAIAWAKQEEEQEQP